MPTHRRDYSRSLRGAIVGVGHAALECQRDDQVGAECGGKAFKDADGGYGSAGFESGDRGLGHAGSLGKFNLRQAELEPAPERPGRCRRPRGLKVNGLAEPDSPRTTTRQPTRAPTSPRGSNMKELRPGSVGMTEICILFAFDPWRSAIC